MRPIGSADSLEQRRLDAVLEMKAGQRPVEVAKILNVTQRSANLWMKKYREDGIEGIKSKPNNGRPSRLNESQLKKVGEALLMGAKHFGYEDDLWSCPRVSEMVEKNFGIRYHPDHIRKILHSLGWSIQRPTRKAVERNENVVKNWVHYKWPKIKKKQENLKQQ